MFSTLRTFAHGHVRLLAVLACIGILAVAFFFYVALFVHTGTPAPISLDGELVAGTPGFVKTFSNVTNSPIEQGSPVSILNNGAAFVPDLITEIQHASSTIDFSTYIWEDGTFSVRVLEALTAAARRGVVVRLLLDGISGSPPEKERAELVTAGGHAAVFHSVFDDPFSADNRNHRRAIVIDNRVGYIGGIAIADSWLGNGKKKDEWRDTMFKLTGTMAQSLDRSFVDQWLDTTGEIITAPQPVSNVAPPTNTFVEVVGSAGDKNRPIAASFLLTALSAQKSLYITNPYVFPDNALRDVLEEKAKSGVDVRILVPGPNTDGPVVRWASQYYYQDLLDAGVRIYEYQPTLMHEKAMVADGVWSLIGSANIDNRSAELNDENVMGIQDPSLAHALVDTFNSDLKNSAEIGADAWRHRSILHRVLSWVMSIPFKQY
ncbi:MAG: phospholipase D-like domain-containing protein [Patescibacteria group bacterium]